MMDPATADFLQRARRGAAPSADDRARVLAATLNALGADALPSTSEQQGAGAAEGAWSGVLARSAQGVVAKLALAALLSGASGGVGYWLGRTHSVREAALVKRSDERAPSDRQPAARPPASARPDSARPGLAARDATETARVADPPPDAQLPAAPVRAALPARGSASTPTSSEGSPSARASADEELRLLRRIQRALADSNPRLALALLTELDRLVPRSQLLEERQAATVVARCQLEDDPAARVSAASAFERRYPESLYSARIRQTCGVPEPRKE
jgi:hypothetical protein